MTTLTNGITTITPFAWTRYRGERTAQTIVHPLASGHAAITLRPATPRTALLAFAFTSEADADQCDEMLATPGILTVSDPSRPTLGMQFVVVRRISLELINDNTLWAVTVEARKVGPA